MRPTQLYVITLGLLLAAPAMGALTAEEKCQAGKNKAAGKYADCRQQAAATLVKTGDMTKYNTAIGKCETKFEAKWQKLVDTASAAGATCPDEPRTRSEFQSVIDQHSSTIAQALGNGVLPDCPSDLATCTADLGTCGGSLSTCTTNLTSTQASLTTCIGDLGTCDTSLSACQSGTATPADVLAGKTFSSSGGVGQTGTMPNNGAVALTPGTAPVTIAAGYHNGSGTVAGDTDLVAGNIKSGVDIFGVTGTVQPPPLRTGQTTDYGTGSDGAVQKGATRSFTDNGNGTITDITTGLMWEKKSDDGSIHDKDNTYTWGSTSNPYPMNGTMVATFLAALNAGSGFAGYTDWRIPNVNELQSLVNYGATNPSVYGAFNSGCTGGCTVLSCSCTDSYDYWSSTTRVDYPIYAWTVFFSTGDVSEGLKSDGLYIRVRAVRGGS